MISKKPKNFFITISVLSIIIIIFVYSSLKQNVNNSNLVYPGNGFPHLSKNKPVKNLNLEMQNYFGKYSFLKFDGTNLKFNNIPHPVKYKSSLKLNGPITNFALDISIDFGKAIINIGEIEYFLTPTEAVIMHGNKEIFSENKLRVSGISVETGFYTDNTKVSVARIRGEKWSNGGYVNIKFPAPISIELLENSSGTIGQWKWLRGFE